jgi:hypothetical protein
MRQSTRQGSNRTGTMAAPEWAEQMVAATREFPPSSPGDALAIAEVRIAYAQEGEGMGEAPTLLMDKLGERLAFEHAGARLYEALLSKHRAYGSFEGGPNGEDLLHILTEEYEHADLLSRAIKTLGGDPTALTPAANLAMNISAGLPQVLSDPRTNLPRMSVGHDARRDGGFSVRLRGTGRARARRQPAPAPTDARPSPRWSGPHVVRASGPNRPARLPTPAAGASAP